MEKGVSPIISVVLLILITVSAIYLVLFVAKPTIDRAYETAATNEAENNLELLDNLIREVASEGTGSYRSVVLKVSDGDYRTVNTSGNFTGALQYKIDLKYSPYTAPMLKKTGNVKYTAGMNGIGLVMYSGLDDGNGTTAADSSDYNNYGVLYNGTTSCANPSTSGAGCPEWVDGKFRKALKFDGSDDYIDIASNFSYTFTELTLEAWINVSQYKNYGKIIDFGSTSATGRRFDLQVESDGLSIGLDGGISGYAKWVSTPSGWLHLVGTWKGTSFVRLYVNGTLKSENTTAPTISSLTIQASDAHIVGRRITATDYFNGTIDEVRIYKRALTADEVKENYNVNPSDYQAFLEYSKIIITGNVKIGKGEHKLCIEKIGELNNKPLVRITAC